MTLSPLGPNQNTKNLANEKWLGPYLLLGSLGEGGQGTVYKGMDPLLQRQVALKFLAQDSSKLEKVIHEARIIASFDHQNIVRIYHISQIKENDSWYLSMEYLEGGSLEEYQVKKGTYLDVAEALQFALQATKALECTHQHGVIHRDIKPSNLLLGKKGVLKVSDFGLSVYSSTFIASSQNVGTPHYMAPELWKKHSPVKKESDIYALGACLYFMLTGRPPFNASSIEELSYQHVHTIPRNPKELNPAIPEELVNIIYICLQKEANKRFRSATELKERIASILNGIDDHASSHNVMRSFDNLFVSLSAETEHYTPPNMNHSRKEKKHPLSDSNRPGKMPTFRSLLSFHESEEPLRYFDIRKFLILSWSKASGSKTPWCSQDAFLLLYHYSNGLMESLEPIFNRCLLIAQEYEQKIITSWTVQAANAALCLSSSEDKLPSLYQELPKKWPDQNTHVLLESIKESFCSGCS